jgi:hypothetical protein
MFLPISGGFASGLNIAGLVICDLRNSVDWEEDVL